MSKYKINVKEEIAGILKDNSFTVNFEFSEVNNDYVLDFLVKNYYNKKDILEVYEEDIAKFKTEFKEIKYEFLENKVNFYAVNKREVVLLYSEEYNNFDVEELSLFLIKVL